MRYKCQWIRCWKRSNQTKIIHTKLHIKVYACTHHANMIDTYNKQYQNKEVNIL